MVAKQLALSFDSAVSAHDFVPQQPHDEDMGMAKHLSSTRAAAMVTTASARLST